MHNKIGNKAHKIKFVGKKEGNNETNKQILD